MHRRSLLLIVVTLLLAACGGSEPIAPERYLQTDGFVEQIRGNVAASSTLSEIVDIDHSRLAQTAGATMPPGRVLIFSDERLAAELIDRHPLIALDLPLRVLAFEAGSDGTGKIIYNNFDYLVARYQLETSDMADLRLRYEQAIAEAIDGIPEAAVASFADDQMQPDGIVTIDSPYGYEETIERVNQAINAQDDTVHFGVHDFQAGAQQHGIETGHAYMILFGGPAPGGQAMAAAPTLGLDGFCQKFLIWQDSNGEIKLSFNDLLSLADRQRASKALALRVINYRLKATFSEALSAD